MRNEECQPEKISSLFIIKRSKQITVVIMRRKKIRNGGGAPKQLKCGHTESTTWPIGLLCLRSHISWGQLLKIIYKTPNVDWAQEGGSNTHQIQTLFLGLICLHGSTQNCTSYRADTDLNHSSFWGLPWDKGRPPPAKALSYRGGCITVLGVRIGLRVSGKPTIILGTLLSLNT